jgi:hypothetical protein
VVVLTSSSSVFLYRNPPPPPLRPRRLPGARSWPSKALEHQAGRGATPRQAARELCSGPRTRATAWFPNTAKFHTMESQASARLKASCLAASTGGGGEIENRRAGLRPLGREWQHPGRMGTRSWPLASGLPSPEGLGRMHIPRVAELAPGEQAEDPAGRHMG